MFLLQKIQGDNIFMLYKGEKFDKYIFKNTILRESLYNFKL